MAGFALVLFTTVTLTSGPAVVPGGGGELLHPVVAGGDLVERAAAVGLAHAGLNGRARGVGVVEETEGRARQLVGRDVVVDLVDDDLPAGREVDSGRGQLVLQGR